MDLTTTYLGLRLRNPLIVGSSSLTLNAKAVERCAAAGAGAVVLKSLFEEQISLESSALDDSVAGHMGQWHSELFEYMEADIGMRYGSRDYLRVIRECRQAVDIPVIASVNCVSSEWWQDFAAETEAAGADALELNISRMPQSTTDTTEAVEAGYEEIVTQARAAVRIPISVKLGPYFTCLPQLVLRLRRAGADGFVLFNRYYRPTIDIETLKVVCGERYSSPGESSVSLRWLSILSAVVDADFAGATGIHSGDDVVRALLAGADAAQVVSVLYRRKPEYLGQILTDLEEWMTDKGYEAVSDFRGMLAQGRNPDTDLFGRLQYIRGLVGIE